jgi:hypothetical protein
MTDTEMFYNIRHLKDFQKLAKSDAVVWCYRWPDNSDIEMYNKKTGETLFTVGQSLHMAEYICSMHNLSTKLIKEVEIQHAA